MIPNSPERFDAIIIGVGQSGKPLATALTKEGWKTAIIERNYVGGSCINYGCTPTKTLLASAQLAYDMRRSAEYGIRTNAVEVDFTAVMQRKNDLVEQSRQSIETALEETEHLTFIRGEARFTDVKQVSVALHDGGTRTLTADHIFIDCGTSPRKPDIDGLDAVDWLNSTTALDLTELPRHLIILGGGYISVEFSQMFRRFGSEVTLIERSGQLLGHEDPDIAEELASILTKEGIQIQLNTQVQQVSQPAPGQIDLQLTTDGKTTSLTGSHLLVAIGTTPNSAALDLATTHVEIDEHGFIRVNDRLETTQPGIYATGDIKGGPAFTHISYDDYRIIQQNLLEGGNATIAGRPVPYTVFTDPQLGRIGLNEKEAREQGKSVRVATLPMKSVARARETGHTEGFMKALVDADTDEILGAAILGMEGGEIMGMIQIAMMGHLPYQRLRDAIFTHPTLSESLNVLFDKVG